MHSLALSPMSPVPHILIYSLPSSPNFRASKYKHFSPLPASGYLSSQSSTVDLILKTAGLQPACCFRAPEEHRIQTPEQIQNECISCLFDIHSHWYWKEGGPGGITKFKGKKCYLKKCLTACSKSPTYNNLAVDSFSPQYLFPYLENDTLSFLGNRKGCICKQ